MKYLITIAITLLASWNILPGQELTQTIRGTIYDIQSKSPLIGVNVIVEDSDPIIGTTSDYDGNFVLENVPVGRQNLKITYIGYEPVLLNNQMVSSAKELVLDIEMLEKINRMDEVVIESRRKDEVYNEIALISARTLSMEEANKYSGTRSDPSRMAQNFAGVSGANDARNDIIIRGNSPAGVLWRMEGVDIPNPNHFGTLGATGGPVTMLNTNNLKSSDFITGAFPSQFGNATAGVFDLQLRNGNNQKYEFLGQIGFNGFELGAEGPLSKNKRGSFIANYRYSTLGVLNALGVNFGTGFAVPEYQDLTFKLNMPTKNAGKFTLFGLGGMSQIEFLAEEDSDGNFFAQDNENQYYTSDMGVMGLSHTYFFSERTRGKFSFAGSVFRSTADEDLVDTDDGTITDELDIDNIQQKYSFLYNVNHKFNSKNTITAGAQFDLSGLNLTQDVLLDGENAQFRIVEVDEFVGLQQAFVNWQHRFSEKVKMNLGLHEQLYTLNNEWTIEPRANIKYQFRPNQSLSLGAGVHSQTQPLEIYFIETRLPDGSTARTNEDLEFTKSYQWVAAYDNNLTKNLRLKVEGYYQHITDAPVERIPSSFSMLNFGAGFGFPDNDSLVSNGRGRNYGLEITLEKFFSRGYYFLTTASIFNSEYKGSDDIWRNTAFNTNYVFNLLGGKEFRLNEKHSLSLDSKLTLAGGQRYTPIDLEASRQAGFRDSGDDKAFSEQNDMYFRWDVKFTYAFQGKKVTQKFSVDLQNATGHQNIFSRQFDADTGNIEETYQIGFFPDVQYRILF